MSAAVVQDVDKARGQRWERELVLSAHAYYSNVRAL